MTTVSVQIPESLARETHEFVVRGYFSAESDVLLAALSDFVRHHSTELMDRFNREDIEWAKKIHAEDGESS